MKHQLKSVLLTILLLSTVKFYGQGFLNGTYTINPSGSGSRNYTTFADAISAANSGISGPVTFIVSPGIYTEQLLINYNSFASATNLIRFTSLNGDSANTIIQYSATSSSSNFVISFDIAEYYIFDHLTFKALNATYGTVIDFTNCSSNIKVESCLLYSPDTAVSSSAIPVIIRCGSMNDVLINNNYISGGYSGIYNSTAGTHHNFVISNNTIMKNYYSGFELYDQENINIISNSIFDTFFNHSPAFGMLINTWRNANLISKNKIFLKGKGNITGIDISDMYSNLTSRTQISNNFISISAISGTASGINTTEIYGIDVFNNSIRINQGNSYSRAIMMMADQSSCKYFNNIFSNYSGSVAEWVSSSNPFFTASYNDLFTTGSILVTFQSNSYTSLSAYQAAQSKESHSVSVDPSFLSITDLHTNVKSLDSSAYSLSTVTDDIDGESRNVNRPDIGADEFVFTCPTCKYWTGTISNNWNESNNWHPAGVPNSSNMAIINNSSNHPFIGNTTGSSPLNVTLSELIINNNAILTINPKSSLTVSSVLQNFAGNSGLICKSTSNGSGNILYSISQVPTTIERYVTGLTSGSFNCHFISSPIINGHDSHIFQTNDKNIYWYDETVDDVKIDSGWKVISPGYLNWGQGYAIFSDYSNRTFRFTGNISAQTVNAAVTYTNTSGTFPYSLDPRGWNLIGNPYPCAINLNTFLTDNSSKLATGFNAVYLWDDTNGDTSRGGDYAIYNLLGGTAASQNSGNTPNGMLAITQACFIKVKPSVTSVVFNAAQRTANTSAQFYVPDAENVNRFKLSIDNNKDLYNEILFGFTPNASIGFDTVYDAIKLFGNSNIALYSILDDKYLAIQALPPVDTFLTASIGYNISASGTYYFRNSLNENPENDLSIFLEDRLKDSLINLVNQKTYSFYSKQGEIKDRFILHFTKNTGNTSIQNSFIPRSKLTLYYSEDILYINYHNPLIPLSSVSVYNSMGSLVFKIFDLKSDINEIPISLDPGCYIVYVKTGSISQVRKIAVYN